MLELEDPTFDADAFLASAGPGRSIVQLRDQQTFFSQGEAADSVFYLQSGRAKLTVLARNGMEATITHLSAGDFAGEESLASSGALNGSTATSISGCSVLKIERVEMLRAMREEYALSERFTNFLLARGMRLQSDLVDQVFNSSEKRLARILLLMASSGDPDSFDALIPAVSEETLAQIVGLKQSAVSFILNRFRDLGLIDYNVRIHVHKALLNAILLDRLPGDNAANPGILYPLRNPVTSTGPSDLSLN